jgi:hypothetical protein
LVSIIRSRTVENGTILTDELTTTITSENQTQEDSRSLIFSYDPDGRVTQRELYDEDLNIHLSHWTYNENGYITEHGFSGTSYTFEDVTNEETLNTELHHFSTYRQNITETETDFERIREQKDGDTTEWLLVDQFRKGEHVTCSIWLYHIMCSFEVIFHTVSYIQTVSYILDCCEDVLHYNISEIALSISLPRLHS